nr:uncharacterized protein LOC108388197 [Manis javanica]
MHRWHLDAWGDASEDRLQRLRPDSPQAPLGHPLIQQALCWGPSWKRAETGLCTPTLSWSPQERLSLHLCEQQLGGRVSAHPPQSQRTVGHVPEPLSSSLGTGGLWDESVCPQKVCYAFPCQAGQVCCPVRPGPVGLSWGDSRVPSPLLDNKDTSVLAPFVGVGDWNWRIKGIGPGWPGPASLSLAALTAVRQQDLWGRGAGVAPDRASVVSGSSVATGRRAPWGSPPGTAPTPQGVRLRWAWLYSATLGLLAFLLCPDQRASDRSHPGRQHLPGV